jgi:predicted GTPase
MYPVTLDESELEKVLELVNQGRSVEYAPARICRLLAKQHSQITGVVNTVCSCGNISDQVSKAINPRIKPLGLYVACVRPPEPIKNKFKQATGQQLWSFYRDAANDDYYNLRDELESIAENNPELVGDSTPSQWEATLKPLLGSEGGDAK